MRHAFLSAVLACSAVHASANSQYSFEAPSSVAGGVVAGAALATVIVLSSVSKPRAINGGENSSCARDSDCASGLFCAPQRAQCVRRDDAASSQARQVTELWLRDRAVELREELVLGRGTIVTGLARALAVAPPDLGRALKRHRAELLGEIGSGSDPTWPARFLRRVDGLALSSQSS